MTDYRCREHPDEPVTWRGTGCPHCGHERTTGRDKAAGEHGRSTTERHHDSVVDRDGIVPALTDHQPKGTS